MTLITQPKTLDEHREIMRKTISRFQPRVEFRRKVGNALLEIVDPDSQPDDSGQQLSLEI